MLEQTRKKRLSFTQTLDSFHPRLKSSQKRKLIEANLQKFKQQSSHSVSHLHIAPHTCTPLAPHPPTMRDIIPPQSPRFPSHSQATSQQGQGLTDIQNGSFVLHKETNFDGGQEDNKFDSYLQVEKQGEQGEIIEDINSNQFMNNQSLHADQKEHVSQNKYDDGFDSAKKEKQQQQNNIQSPHKTQQNKSLNIEQIACSSDSPSKPLEPELNPVGPESSENPLKPLANNSSKISSENSSAILFTSQFRDMMQMGQHPQPQNQMQEEHTTQIQETIIKEEKEQGNRGQSVNGDMKNQGQTGMNVVDGDQQSQKTLNSSFLRLGEQDLSSVSQSGKNIFKNRSNRSLNFSKEESLTSSHPKNTENIDTSRQMADILNFGNMPLATYQREGEDQDNLKQVYKKLGEQLVIQITHFNPTPATVVNPPSQQIQTLKESETSRSPQPPTLQPPTLQPNQINPKENKQFKQTNKSKESKEEGQGKGQDKEGEGKEGKEGRGKEESIGQGVGKVEQGIYRVVWGCKRDGFDQLLALYQYRLIEVKNQIKGEQFRKQLEVNLIAKCFQGWKTKVFLPKFLADKMLDHKNKEMKRKIFEVFKMIHYEAKIKNQANLYYLSKIFTSWRLTLSRQKKQSQTLALKHYCKKLKQTYFKLLFEGVQNLRVERLNRQLSEQHYRYKLLSKSFNNWKDTVCQRNQNQFVSLTMTSKNVWRQTQDQKWMGIKTVDFKEIKK